QLAEGLAGPAESHAGNAVSRHVRRAQPWRSSGGAFLRVTAAQPVSRFGGNARHRVGNLRVTHDPALSGTIDPRQASVHTTDAGAMLRAAREQAGMSLDAVSAQLKLEIGRAHV